MKGGWVLEKGTQMNIYVGISLHHHRRRAGDVVLKHGTVERASVITDRETGRPRGFGFVEMPDNDGRKASRHSMASNSPAASSTSTRLVPASSGSSRTLRRDDAFDRPHEPPRSKTEGGRTGRSVVGTRGTSRQLDRQGVDHDPSSGHLDRAEQTRTASAATAATVVASSTNSATNAPHSASGSPDTRASTTPATVRSARSTNAGWTFSPPVTITASARPNTVSRPLGVDRSEITGHKPLVAPRLLTEVTRRHHRAPHPHPAVVVDGYRGTRQRSTGGAQMRSGVLGATVQTWEQVSVIP